MQALFLLEVRGKEWRHAKEEQGGPCNVKEETMDHRRIKAEGDRLYPLLYLFPYLLFLDL